MSDIRNLGVFENVAALWAAHPEGGQEGDYAYIGVSQEAGTKYRWNKYDRIWENAETVTQSPGRLNELVEGDVEITGDLIVHGSGGGGGGDVDPENLVNEDDVNINTDGKIQFADRAYNALNPNGLGYKILRSDKTFAEQVTDINTIYEIRYAFDLDSESVTIPSGCVLKFNGGNLKNGTIVGNVTSIMGDNKKAFDIETISFSGTWESRMNAAWLGAKANVSDFDNSDIIKAWLGGYADKFKELYFPTGTYYFLTGASLTSDRRNLVLNGCGSTFNINISTDDAYFLTLSNSNQSGSSGENFLLENVRIANVRQTSGNNLSKTRALYLDRAQRFNIQNVQFWYFDIAITLKDCWYGGIGGLSFFYGNRVGISAIKGDYYELNTIEIHNVDFSGVSRSVIESVYPQESGESDADYIMRTGAAAFDAYVLLQGVSLRGCVFEGWDYAVRLNYSKRSSSASVEGGGFTIDGCYFEANRQEDIYAGNGNYANDGSGSSVIRYGHKVNVFGCRFATLKHSAICGGHYVFINNEPITIKVIESSYVSTSIDYDGNITFDISDSPNAAINKYSNIDFNSIYQVNGQRGSGYQSIKPILFSRMANRVQSKLGGFAYDSTSPGSNPFVHSPWSFLTEPVVNYALDIKPFAHYNDIRNSYSKILVPSGDGMIPVSVDSSYNFRALNCNGGIPLYEFLRRWKAGTAYTGRVQNVFPYVVTANPTTGLVTNESGTIVGFGINAIGNTTFSVGYYIFVDAMVTMRFSYNNHKLYADMLQCGRNFKELNKGIDSESSGVRLWGTETQMASVRKRINAVFYDTTNSKLMIYNGFNWVEMTSPYQRYYFNSFGTKLAERATMPDMPGQTFTNLATGIKYTFVFANGLGTAPVWLTSIGQVNDLSHPNGYTDDNTLDYANELSVGEQVMYNGALYKWDGSAFVAV